jgi:phosphoketolase
MVPCAGKPDAASGRRGLFNCYEKVIHIVDGQPGRHG